MGQGNARIYNVISIIFVILTVVVILLIGARLAGPAPVSTQVAQALPTSAVLPSATLTFTPSSTPIPSVTFTPTFTDTATELPTGTFTARPTVTATLSPTPGPTSTTVPTGVPTAIPTNSPVPTNPPAATLTFTLTPSLTITTTLPFTSTPQPSVTPPPPTNAPFTAQPPVDVPPPFPFSLRDDQPVFTSNFANTAGCSWQGIGGQIFDTNDQPLLGVTVHVFGTGVDTRVNSGSNTIYGASGWEVPLGTALSGNSYRVELMSPAGTIISSQITVTFTANDCGRNLALVNFKQNRPL